MLARAAVTMETLQCVCVGALGFTLWSVSQPVPVLTYNKAERLLEVKNQGFAPIKWRSAPRFTVNDKELDQEMKGVFTPMMWQSSADKAGVPVAWKVDISSAHLLASDVCLELKYGWIR